ncbi:MAG: hypothetical protein IJT98_00120 [Prevotella sp.]|nr:hypothetical protein [Prevotella sp.]
MLQASRSHYSTDDGLCSNAISDIKRDDQGYIWIATWNGLSRFDGYHFYNYRTGAGSHIPHLHNRVSRISIDSQQNIWMLMYDARVFMMKRSTDQIINPFQSINGNEDFRTNCPVMVASNGDVLVHVIGVGIYRLRPERDNFNMQLITTRGLTVTCMAEGYQGDIWLGTDQGIHRMDPSNMTVERRGNFMEENITCIFSDGYNVFAGTQSGKVVAFAYGSEPTVVREGSQPITSIFADSHGLIWFSDGRAGVYRLNRETGDEKLFTQNVTVPDYDGYGGFFNEAMGVVWVRLNHGGYGYYNREADQIEYFHNDPVNPWNLSNTVNAVLELDEGVVFESTTLRGLEKLEIINENITRTMLVPDAESTLQNETRALLYDAERHLTLIGNKASQLFFFNDSNQLVSTITQNSDGNPIGRCYGLSKDSRGNYWMSSKDNGITRITPTAGGGYSVVNMHHDDDDQNSLSSNSAYATIEDKAGNIWVATYGGGVNVLTQRGGKQVFLHWKNGMNGYPYNSYLRVRTLAVDNEGTVWAGTTDGILLMSLKDGNVKVERLLESEEYPDSILMSNDIVCLGVDKTGTMWVGTNGGGIAHVTGKDSKGRWLFRSFGVADGLPSEEIKSLTFDSFNNVWFATDNIICSYNREKHIFSTFSTMEGVDNTMCSEGAAITQANDNVLFGTVNGYYTIDRKKLINAVGSALKLRITDFFIDDVLQSPRFNDNYDFYIPEASVVELDQHSSVITLRFASLNYQLQHRVHYQYTLAGYDKGWINAPRNREVSYSNLPTGTYVFQVKAFLLESPERFDMKRIKITIPPYWILSSSAVWLYMVVAAMLCIRLMFWRQRQIRLRMAPYSEVEKESGFNLFPWRKKKEKKEAPVVDDTDEYELLD